MPPGIGYGAKSKVLNNYYDGGGQYYPELFSDLGIGPTHVSTQPGYTPEQNTPTHVNDIPRPQGIEGFMSVLNDPGSGLNQWYSNNGADYTYNMLSEYPHLYEQFGVSLEDVANALGIGGIQQGSGDPFLDFLANQMNIAGFGQQQPQPSRNDFRSRWGSEPAPQQGPSIYQQMLSQLTGYDPLLSSLLKQFQPAPEPPPISNYKFGGY